MAARAVSENPSTEARRFTPGTPSVEARSASASGGTSALRDTPGTPTAAATAFANAAMSPERREKRWSAMAPVRLGMLSAT